MLVQPGFPGNRAWQFHLLSCFARSDGNRHIPGFQVWHIYTRVFRQKISRRARQEPAVGQHSPNHPRGRDPGDLDARCLDIRGTTRWFWRDPGPVRSGPASPICLFVARVSAMRCCSISDRPPLRIAP